MRRSLSQALARPDSLHGGSGRNQGGATSAGVSANSGVRFAACIRAHGVPDFPDPGGSLPPGLKHVPVFQTAMKACLKLEPPGTSTGKHFNASQRATALAQVRCIRDHGTPNFPDPTFPASGGELFPAIAGFNPASQRSDTPQPPARSMGRSGSPTAAELNADGSGRARCHDRDRVLALDPVAPRRAKRSSRRRDRSRRNRVARTRSARGRFVAGSAASIALPLLEAAGPKENCGAALRLSDRMLVSCKRVSQTVRVVPVCCPMGSGNGGLSPCVRES